MAAPAFIFGGSNLGACKMRGQPMAARYRLDLVDAHKPVFRHPRWPHALVVKYHCGRIAAVRARCRRLWLDVLDNWSSIDKKAEPGAWWRRLFKETGALDFIAAVPGAAESMRLHLPERVRVHYVPHAADPHIRPDWYAPDGHVVYAGGLHYLGDQLGPLREACRLLGRPLVTRDDPGAYWALRGAALSLCLRLPPEDTPLNRLAKPGVKLENAAAAGLPVLASDHPCVAELRPEAHVTARTRGTPKEWADEIDRALRSTRLTGPVDVVAYTDTLGRCMGLKDDAP